MRGDLDVIGALWATLRALDASKDARKNAPPVLRLKEEMLRTIAELQSASAPGRSGKIELFLTEQGPRKPDGAA